MAELEDEPLIEQHAVGEARQMVVVGEVPQPFLSTFAFRDVASNRLKLYQLGLLVPDGARTPFLPVDSAICSDYLVLLDVVLGSCRKGLRELPERFPRVFRDKAKP